MLCLSWKLLLAANSITALYCFPQLLKISLCLASSVSSPASLPCVLFTTMRPGTLTAEEVHQHTPWGLE